MTNSSCQASKKKSDGSYLTTPETLNSYGTELVQIFPRMNIKYHTEVPVSVVIAMKSVRSAAPSGVRESTPLFGI